MHAVGFIHAVGICAFEVRMEWQQENNKKNSNNNMELCLFEKSVYGRKSKKKNNSTNAIEMEPNGWPNEEPRKRTPSCTR